MEPTSQPNRPPQPSRKPAPRGPGAPGPRPQFGPGRTGPRRSRPMYARPAHPRRGKQRIEHAPESAGKRTQKVPPPAENVVRIIPLGGVEEIGRNMTAIETADDIFILDCGFQFREDDTPGIDYILPNTGYLEERPDKIRGLIISNGPLAVIDGRSMRTNLEIAREIGLVKFKDDTVVPVEDMEKYSPEKLIILATGAQGDEFASLARIGNKSHKYIRLQPSDTIVLSSSVIPGNERAVQKLKDNLSRQGAHIITYHTSDVHASGHGNRGEAEWIHKQIHPKFFVPVHGYHYMLRVHADVAVELGMDAKHIVIPDNSSVIEITDGEKITKHPIKAPAEMRVVEGQTVSELSDVLMRDRKALGQEGFCVVVATVDRRSGKLHKSPDIISRGFVYLRDNKELMDQTRLIIRKSVETSLRNPRAVDLDQARDDLAESVSRFLLQRTQKRPIVIPVIVSV